MKGRLVITESGKLSVFIDEGSFDEAVAEIEKVFEGLIDEGIEFLSVDPAEAHRHDEHGNHVHVHGGM